MLKSADTSSSSSGSACSCGWPPRSHCCWSLYPLANEYSKVGRWYACVRKMNHIHTHIYTYTSYMYTYICMHTYIYTCIHTDGLGQLQGDQTIHWGLRAEGLAVQAQTEPGDRGSVEHGLSPVTSLVRLPHTNSVVSLSLYPGHPAPTLWSQLSCHLPQGTCSFHALTLSPRSSSLHPGPFSTPCRSHVTSPSRSSPGVCSVTGLAGVEDTEFRGGCFCSWLHTLACLLLASCQGQSSPPSPGALESPPSPSLGVRPQRC